MQDAVGDIVVERVICHVDMTTTNKSFGHATALFTMAWRMSVGAKSMLLRPYLPMTPTARFSSCRRRSMAVARCQHDICPAQDTHAALDRLSDALTNKRPEEGDKHKPVLHAARTTMSSTVSLMSPSSPGDRTTTALCSLTIVNLSFCNLKDFVLKTSR